MRTDEAKKTVEEGLPMWGNVPERDVPRLQLALRTLIARCGGRGWICNHPQCLQLEQPVLHAASFRPDDVRRSLSEHVVYDRMDLYLRDYHARQLLAGVPTKR